MEKFKRVKKTFRLPKPLYRVVSKYWQPRKFRNLTAFVKAALKSYVEDGSPAVADDYTEHSRIVTCIFKEPLVDLINRTVAKKKMESFSRFITFAILHYLRKRGDSEIS